MTMGNVDSKSQQLGFKIIVLHEVDNLSKEAQAALRRTMEKCMKTCRIIMTCETLTKIIPPIRSRCISIRIASPKETEIKDILQKINKQEGINLNETVLQKIIKSSNRNLRYAINMLQFST